jgi:hypothetical protein
VVEITRIKKNNTTFTTSEWCVDATAEMLRYWATPVKRGFFPEVDSGTLERKEKNDINDLQMELFNPINRPKKYKR